jgi:hypothetical protein
MPRTRKRQNRTIFLSSMSVTRGGSGKDTPVGWFTRSREVGLSDGVVLGSQKGITGGGRGDTVLSANMKVTVSPAAAVTEVGL